VRAKARRAVSEHAAHQGGIGDVPDQAQDRHRHGEPCVAGLREGELPLLELVSRVGPLRRAEDDLFDRLDHERPVILRGEEAEPQQSGSEQLVGLLAGSGLAHLVGMELAALFEQLGQTFGEDVGGRVPDDAPFLDEELPGHRAVGELQASRAPALEDPRQDARQGLLG
jgi:hypothetical protein